MPPNQSTIDRPRVPPQDQEQLDRQSLQDTERTRVDHTETPQSVLERIQDDERRIAAVAQTRFDSFGSLGIDASTAQDVLITGGFADRITSIIRAMTALMKDTQADMRARAGHAERQKDTRETTPEGDATLLTLDTYMASRVVEGLDALKDMIRMIQLRFQRVEDPERVLGLIRYFEDCALSKAQEKTPPHFDMRNAPRLAELLDATNDPVAVFEQLSRAGYTFKEGDISLYAPLVKEVLGSPHIIQLLKKIERLGIAPDTVGANVFFSDGRTAEAALELARMDSEQSLLDETSLKNIAVLSEVTRHPMSMRFVRDWIDLARDEASMEVLDIARQAHPEKFPVSDDSALFLGLHGLRAAGITEDIVALAREGFDSGIVSSLVLGSRDSAEVLPIIQELKDPTFREFAIDLSKMMGRALPSDAKAVGRYRRWYAHEGALHMLGMLIRNDIFTKEQWHLDTINPDVLFKDEKVILAINQPDFEPFLIAMKKAGLKLGSYFLEGDGSFMWAYEAEGFRQLIMQGDNAELLRTLGVFHADDWRWYISNLERLMNAPNALANVQLLAQNYGYQRSTETYSSGIALLADRLEDKEITDALSRPETQEFFSLIKSVGYTKNILHGTEHLLKLAKSRRLREELADPETQSFIRTMASDPDMWTLCALAHCDASLRPTLIVLKQEFDYSPPVQSADGHGNALASQSIRLRDKNVIQTLHDDPRILEAALALKRAHVDLSPVFHQAELREIIIKGLVDSIVRYEGSPAVQAFIVKHREQAGYPGEEVTELFTNALSESERTIRDRQLVRGELVGALLGDGEYGLLAETVASAENRKEIERIIERLKRFIESYPVGGKGRTIVTLLAMREYREGEGMSDVLQRMGRQINRYDRLLENITPHAIPSGLRASIGLEYEITKSTAEQYAVLHNKSHLGNDMCDVSRFANVGHGRDAVWEVATKPTDNPYLMLLELQILQDLEFFDFNFQRAGYENGARGIHLTIGGEHGVSATANANFLQNTLIISGWGGINAGKEVRLLSQGRHDNIRERNAISTEKVFENTRNAVEFRSLSLDTWEPFERAVETSFYGAIAIQATERYTTFDISQEQQRQGVEQSKTPEEFFAFLRDSDLLKEEPGDKKVQSIIFEWARLQADVLKGLDDHNENFLQNEMYGYEDERGRWVEAGEFGGAENQQRFLSATRGRGALEEYAKKTQISQEMLLAPARPELANSCTAITNLFLKRSEASGGDVANATAMLDTTKRGMVVQDDDPRAKYQSVFDTNGKSRDGYYYTQGGSERMLIHRTQTRLLEFTQCMKAITSKE